MIARSTILNFFTTSALLCVTVFAAPAMAQSGGREAHIVVDADTKEILSESQAREARFPASITKVMTIYLVFDALERGTLSWNDRIVFSRNASAQPPTKLFVRAGDSISVQTAVEALILRSANDVATAVAEKLGGTEANFAQMMTAKARELGMASTTFRNASGWPNPAQHSTAEDLARLAIAIHRDFPEQYHWFGATQMTYNGQVITGHNHLMHRMAGMDGLKTGYTRASGFNLAATTQRNGRRVVTVVLGGSNRHVRDDLVESLTETAFRDPRLSATQFASVPSAYQISLTDVRDGADAAALIMDLPQRQILTGGSATMAMNRTSRRLTFEPGASQFQVADMTAPSTRWPSRSAINTRTSGNEAGETGMDEGEDVSPSQAAPVRQATPVRNAPATAPTPVPVPFRVAVVTPVETTRDTTPTPLRGSSNEEAAAPQSDAPSTQMAELARQDAADLATASPPNAQTSELNGSVNLADNVDNTEAAPVQMAALDGEAVAAAQRRQEEATAREQARLGEAVAIETAKRDAARQAALAAREQAQREAAARRATERQLEMARVKAQREKEARELALAERAAVRERALAAAAEERRQAEAARLRTTRGNAVVQVGAFKDRGDATAAIARFSRFFPSFAQSEVTSVTRKDGTWYRARFAGLGAMAAREACNLVTGRGGACAIVGD